MAYIEVQNQVQYGGQMFFFFSYCFWKLLITALDRSFSWQFLSLHNLLSKIGQYWTGNGFVISGRKKGEKKSEKRTNKFVQVSGK